MILRSSESMKRKPRVFFFLFSNSCSNRSTKITCKLLPFGKIGSIKPFHACVNKISVFPFIVICTQRGVTSFLSGGFTTEAIVKSLYGKLINPILFIALLKQKAKLDQNISRSQIEQTIQEEIGMTYVPKLMN